MAKASSLAVSIAQALRPILAETYPIVLPNEYRYAHLSLAVIDAIYSIGVRYEGTHATVLRYARHQHLSPYRDGSSPQWPPIESQEPLAQFVQQYHTQGVEEMMNTVYQNRQRTSSRHGIPKAEAVLRVAEVLLAHQVNYFQDIPRIVNHPDFETQFRMIPGQGSGISLVQRGPNT